MSKGNKGSTSRRASSPNRPQRPYKPIPVITERHRGKAKIDEESKRRPLVERFKDWGRGIRGWFGRKKKRRIETKTIKSKWRREDVSQEERDRGIRKAAIKARNRRKRKSARALHQAERRRV